MSFFKFKFKTSLTINPCLAINSKTKALTLLIQTLTMQVNNNSSRVVKTENTVTTKIKCNNRNHIMKQMISLSTT